MTITVRINSYFCLIAFQQATGHYLSGYFSNSYFTE
ncbi:hypothetical protein SAMN04488128_103959 [Chitinophaga eiseniae]|uniref:Uncharacterized protein n=1 Tax=Chitinophaga eiseniae TaxID=634771 RepID=A0A1T4T1U7_9BACT|nr:hypothetical protein SAMN04488128_103959 [Chitinophaga eiseniae]